MMVQLENEGFLDKEVKRTAARLVDQVLDDAYILAQAAQESDEPSLYVIDILKKIANDSSLNVTVGDVAGLKIDDDIKSVTTSTPQKLFGVKPRFSANESMFLGQGDEQPDLVQYENPNSSSYVSHMFDMSDDERNIDYKGYEPTPALFTVNPVDDVTNILETCFVNAVNTKPSVIEQKRENVGVAACESELAYMEYTDHTFLTDVFGPDIAKNVAFYIGSDLAAEVMDNFNKEDILKVVPVTMCSTITKEEIQIEERTSPHENPLQDVDAFLTLNREESCSEEEYHDVFDETKRLSMHDVELLTNTSQVDDDDDTLKPEEETKLVKEEESKDDLKDTSMSESRRSLTQRFCSGSARLLARLRGWWRRRTPVKRKECRGRGACGRQLSPDARHRACSLLDQRHLRSPSPARALLWKFNTVNDAVVSSSRFKKFLYTFETKTDEVA